MIPTGLSFRAPKGLSPHHARATELREAAEMSIPPRSAAGLSFPPAGVVGPDLLSPSATVVGLVITHHSRNPGLHAMIATVVSLLVVFSHLNDKTVRVMDVKGRPGHGRAARPRRRA